MTVDIEAPVRRSKEKWIARLLARQTTKEYLDCGKVPTTAKCPKCDALHEVYIQWTGRGMPRIFCGNCRPVVAAFCEINGTGSAPEYAKSSRKGIPHNFD